MSEDNNNADPDKRGVEGLTEVLRLQAEALSRISERMAGSGFGQSAGKAPPQSQKKEPSQDGFNLPVLAGDPSLKEESLPVLNSFKQFLEQERRRGRKRLMWGLLGFTVAFSGVLVILIQMNREQELALKTDIQRTSTRLDRSQQMAEAELKKVADKAAQSVANQAATIRTDITRNILWAHSALASNMNSELNGRDGEIERLKEKVSTLEVDNTMLARKVAELVQRVKIIEQDYLDNIERSLTESQISMMPEMVAVPATNLAPVVERSPSLMINSAKYGRTMQMRVPKE